MIEDKLKSYSNTYYLLIGYAYENLIKGLSIKKNPELSFDELFNEKWRRYKSGHGFSNIFADILENVSIEDCQLLERLEAYIIWLGKYPVAKNSTIHVAEYDKRYFDSNDKIRIDSLYEKIKELYNQN
ncbi:MAG: hypothetical protein JXB49_36470 [Bacteroidales bacterium]|nr:hypothetical protein [Bacteroidales bacterium]